MCSKLISMAAFVLLSVGLYAQPQMNGNGQFPPMNRDFSQGDFPQREGEMKPRENVKDPATLAKEEADLMQSEVGLDKKQYKKVYNLLKKDYTYRQQARPSGPQMGDGEMPSDFGGGMPGVFGGGMPGGNMGGFGGGMPGGMGPGGDMGSFGGASQEVKTITQEYIDGQDAKLKAILTDEQYTKWRNNHPVEILDIPDLVD